MKVGVETICKRILAQLLQRSLWIDQEKRERGGGLRKKNEETKVIEEEEEETEKGRKSITFCYKPLFE